MLIIATTTDSLAAAIEENLQRCMNRQHTHADGTLLPRGQLPKRADILLGAEIELASSFIKLLLDALANLLVLLAVTVLTILVTIPNALASVALLEGIAYLSARRTHFGWGISRHGCPSCSNSNLKYLKPSLCGWPTYGELFQTFSDRSKRGRGRSNEKGNEGISP